LYANSYSTWRGAAPYSILPFSLLSPLMCVSGCGHCQEMAPQFEEAAKRLVGTVAVGKVNCDLNRDTCTKEFVKGYPTVKFYKYYSHLSLLRDVSYCSREPCLCPCLCPCTCTCPCTCIHVAVGCGLWAVTERAQGRAGVLLPRRAHRGGLRELGQGEAR
jgi:hypothetical protein